MDEKCFCHLNGYKVKDVDARKNIGKLTGHFLKIKDNGYLDLDDYKAAVAAGERYFTMPANVEVNIDEPITVKSNMCFIGNNAYIIAAGDFPVFSGVDVGFVTIDGFRLGKAHSNCYTVELSGYNNEIKNCRLQSGGGTAKAGIYFKASEVNNFVNSVRNCTIIDGSIRIESTDSEVIDCIVWNNGFAGTPDDYAITTTYGSQHISGNQIVGGKKGGLFCSAGAAAMLDICNNFFDGSYPDIETGDGIVLSGTAGSVVISGNKFSNQTGAGIRTTANAYRYVISNNVFYCNNKGGAGVADIYAEMDGGTMQGIIANNQFINTRTLATGASFNPVKVVSPSGSALQMVNNSAGNPSEGYSDGFVNPAPDEFNHLNFYRGGVQLAAFNGVCQKIGENRIGCILPYDFDKLQLLFAPDVYLNGVAASGFNYVHENSAILICKETEETTDIGKHMRVSGITAWLA